jgi:sigma-54 dependent transcriptional regulator, acetoin dehydrogenase operon transcriptional activator AcoR
MLSDERAVVLSVLGDERSVSGPESVPGPGALCAEETCGANGLGTPLAESGYVEIVGPEHFISGFHPFTCQGVPIRDLNGEVVGVLSTSVRVPEASIRLKEILLCGAYGIEAALLGAKLVEDVKRLDEADPSYGGLLEQLRQDVMQGLNQAHLHLQIASRISTGKSSADAASTIKMAAEAAQLFNRRARLCLDLVSPEVSRPESVILSDLAQKMIDLLATEAAIRKVELVMTVSEPAQVTVERRSLLRLLLRQMLKALDLVGEGGAVVIEVRETMPHIECEVCITPLVGRQPVTDAPTPIAIKVSA